MSVQEFGSAALSDRSFLASSVMASEALRGEALGSVPAAPGDFSHGRKLYVRWGGKRILDILVALLALIFLLPLFPIIVIGIGMQDGFPVIFRQRRIGQGGRSFQCLKFRTMSRDADHRLQILLATCVTSRAEWESVQKLRRDPRINAFGRLLRRSSLDELPQLFNVLRGDMSIVGPRPIMPDQVALYRDKFVGYCAAKPGLTGPWQVGGRSHLTFQERTVLDACYADGASFFGDVRIIAKTFRVVLAGYGSC